MKKLPVCLLILLAHIAKGQSEFPSVQTPILFSTVAQMLSYNGPNQYAALTDSSLGGIFFTIFGSHVPDGVNIISTAIGDRYWKRLTNGSGGGIGLLILNNMAQLSTTPPPASFFCEVLGFYTPNDGGGGFFWFNTSDNSAPVSGFIAQVGQDSGRWNRLPTKGNIFDCRWFGLVGDGVTDNRALLQNAVNYMGTYQKGATIYFPACDAGKSYLLSKRVLWRSFVNMQGDGKNSVLYNNSTSGVFGATFPIAWGNMEVPSFTDLTEYHADSIYENRIKLHTASDANNFHKNDLITLTGLTSFTGAGGFPRPYVGEVSKVDSVSTSTGVIIMNDVIDTTLTGGNVGINGHFAASGQGAVDELDDSCRIIEHCNISNLYFKSDGAWFGRLSMYKCNFSNIWSYGENGWGGNCVARCIFSNFNMQFWRRAQETDLFAHDSRFENFTASYVPGRAGNGNKDIIPQIRLAENSRNLYFKGYTLNIMGYFTGPPVEFNEGVNNTIDGLTVHGNYSNQGAAMFRVERDSAFVNNCKIINSSFFLDTTSSSYVTFDMEGNTHAQLRNNMVSNCYFYNNLGGRKAAVDFDGTNNMVLGGFMRDTSAVILSRSASTINCIISTTLLFHNAGNTGVSSIYGITNDGKKNIIAPQSSTISGISALLSGNRNTSMGYHALDTLKSGNDNTAYGFNALSSIRAGDNNTAVGAEALELSDTGVSANTAVGWKTLRNVQSGANTAMGTQALLNLTTGSATAIGYQALLNLTTGARNSGFGYQAGINNTSGNDNSYFGREAGDSNYTGSGNLFFGINSGSGLKVGANNLYIGKNTFATSYSDSNTMNIASSIFAVNLPNANSSDSTTTGAARFGIGVRQPVAFLEIRPSTSQNGSLLLEQGAGVSSSNRVDGLFWIDSASGLLKVQIKGIVYNLNQPIVFTPKTENDPTYPIGTETVDDHFIWYKNSGGFWVKAAWEGF